MGYRTYYRRHFPGFCPKASTRRHFPGFRKFGDFFPTSTIGIVIGIGIDMIGVRSREGRPDTGATGVSDTGATGVPTVSR